MNHCATLNSKEDLIMKKIYALGLAVSLVILTATSICFAANYDYKTMTPEIEQALKNRQARYHQLQSLKQEGVIGEDNRGYVTDLKNNAAAATLATDENRDRRVLYEALAEQNALGSTGLLEIQRAFAEVQREKAGPGDMVQSSSGDWQKK
ncbi:MAG: hypothetical protein A2351_00040 [Omnitrophica bacterium RIFOXYB12_FULL_50_7]|nr:MAG: hypothetical protein A2351_00040 [Omnitrophica bacterium RIFOXYB12_FULL_50_7]